MATLLKFELTVDDLAPEDVNRLLLVQILGNLHNFKDSIMATVAELQAALTALSAKVAAETDIVQSVETLLNGLTAMIADLKTQLAAAGVPQAVLDQVAALSTAVDGMSTQLSADVTKNTPAA